MSVQELTLQWIPEGIWEKRLHKPLGGDISLFQELIGDETAEEVIDEVRLHYGSAYPPALTGQPVIRVVMVSSGQRAIKPLSAVLRCAAPTAASWRSLTRPAAPCRSTWSTWHQVLVSHTMAPLTVSQRAVFAQKCVEELDSFICAAAPVHAKPL